MNRIAGILNFDHSPVDPEAINRMVHAMKLQAGDGECTWIDGGIGLGCARIGRSAGVSDEPSPYCHPNRKWVIAYDGRIDNRQELSETLKSLLTATGKPGTDERLVLAAYEKWGQDFARHLTGDFALAVWDREKQTLICARDHFGVKPFYYSFSGGSFIFASTPRALLAPGRVQPVMNEARIADFLVNPLEGIDKTSSFYADVFRLEPAYHLIVQAGGWTKQPYWQIDSMVNAEFKTEGEYTEAFRELFKAAVRCRLQDTSMPASMLSGGMDSSAIVGMGGRILAEAGGGPLHTFAAISDSPEINRETPHIMAVLEQGGLQPHLISEAWLRARMDELVRGLEAEAEPFDCLMNLNRAVYLAARDMGISSLLDGIDGDVLLSGSGRFTRLWRRGAFRTIIHETWQAEGLTAEYRMGRNLFFSSLVSAITPVPPEWMRRIRRKRQYRAMTARAVEETIIDRGFAFRSRLDERFARLDSHSPRPSPDNQMEYHRIAFEHPFLTVGLERYERVTSSFGIEARHPFTDIRLAEFCLGLPWQLKTQNGWTKMMLRRAMEADLPRDVIWRRDKDNLMWEFNRVILKERADYFHQLTMDESESLRPYVDMNKLACFWQEYLRDGEEKHAPLIWSGIALAMWLHQQRNMKAGWM